MAISNRPEPRRPQTRSQRAKLLLGWLPFGTSSNDSAPPVGKLQFGDLRRTTPVSAEWGFDRGHVIDRYYIDQFLARFSSDVRGRALEIGGDFYSRRFGGGRVTCVDALHVSDALPTINIIGDLTAGDFIRSDTYDCIIITQTLQFIYDIQSVVRTLERILKPGGVVLATVAGISKVSVEDMERWGDYWRFTSLSARKLFEEAFKPDHITVQCFGNVLTASAFLFGLATEDLTKKELDDYDPNFPTIVGIRAVKPLVESTAE